MKSPPPIHQWTHAGDKVLFVKIINKDRTTGGVGGQPKIVWPESGPVKCSDWKPQAVYGNGIHAWPWGMFVGDGKEPNACQPWLVLAVDPADVVQIDGGRCKFPKCEVVYSGEMAGAMYYTSTGRVAWIVDSSSGSAAATGYSGSAAATGDRGIAAITVADKYSIIEVSTTGIGAVQGEMFNWKVHTGAIIVQRWARNVAMLKGAKKNDGKTVLVVKGKVQK